MNTTSFFLKVAAGIFLMFGLFFYAVKPWKTSQVQIIDGVVGGPGSGAARDALEKVKKQFPKAGEFESNEEAILNQACKDIPKPSTPLDPGCKKWSCINGAWQQHCN